MVSAENKNGAWHIYSTPNDGKNHTDEYTLTTSKENYANYNYLGAGNNPKDATKMDSSWDEASTTEWMANCHTGPGIANASTASTNMVEETIPWSGIETDKR